MSFSAIIPAANLAAANATLQAQGYGPGNFSVPLRVGPTDAEASHVGMNAIAGSAAFRAAVAALPGVSMRDAPLGAVEFAPHTTAQALRWEGPENWIASPVMIGAQRSYSGKTWESLVDYNVWTPPVAWREVVVTGYPAWVQPTGAHDAYALGFIVTHLGQNWISDYAANVWAPGAFGWTVKP
jgi:hypothetical protein